MKFGPANSILAAVASRPGIGELVFRRTMPVCRQHFLFQDTRKQQLVTSSSTMLLETRCPRSNRARINDAVTWAAGLVAADHPLAHARSYPQKKNSRTAETSGVKSTHQSAATPRSNDPTIRPCCDLACGGVEDEIAQLIASEKMPDCANCLVCLYRADETTLTGSSATPLP